MCIIPPLYIASDQAGLASRAFLSPVLNFYVQVWFDMLLTHLVIRFHIICTLCLMESLNEITSICTGSGNDIWLQVLLKKNVILHPNLWTKLQFSMPSSLHHRFKNRTDLIMSPNIITYVSVILISIKCSLQYKTVLQHYLP